MYKKLTIMIDQKVYAGLYKIVGARKISRFIEDLIRPHVMSSNLMASYEEMSQDETREQEALEWSEGIIGDIQDEPR